MEATVKQVDQDFHPDGTKDILYLDYTVDNLSSYLASHNFPFYSALGRQINTWIATFFVLFTFLFVMVMNVLAFAFAFAYWHATKLRDRAFYNLLLHGAKPVHEVSQAEQQPGSYDEFCQVNHHTQNHRPSYRTILQIAVKATLWAVYFGMLLGGYLIWYGLAIPRWKRTLLQRYDTESDTLCVIGSVVSKQHGRVIVQFNNVIPDSLELIYLKDAPESAIYKGPLEHQRLAQERMRSNGIRRILRGIFFVRFQITIHVAVFCRFCSTLESAYWFRGILLTCHLVLEFPGVWIRFQTVVQKGI
jgi:hypothetical protein